MAAHKSYLDRYRTPPVYVVCPVCRWDGHRQWQPCEQEHIDLCSCHYGRCPECEGQIMEGAAWRKVCAENISPPRVPGVEIRLLEWATGYAVGDDGSVWSCRLNSGRCDMTRWRRLKPVRLSNGHFSVGVVAGGVRKLYYVHRLVLEAFVGPRPEGMEACHFPDRDPGNNRLCNLRWDTRQANADDMLIHGTQAKGVGHGRARLDEPSVMEIRRRHSDGVSVASLARAFGVNWSTVNRAVRRERWAHV